MIETPRLILRPWREDDKPAFEAIINTPAMMEHFGGVWPKGEHDALIDTLIEDHETSGLTMWAVDDKATGALIGVCGIRWSRRYPELPVYGELEIGWRISEPYWGKGIAREAAEASIAYGWAHTDAPRISAWTTKENVRSWGLMVRLGMQRRPELDFQHPKYAPDDPFGAEIVYAIDRPA